MSRERLTIPEQNVREYAHELAYTLARQQLAGIKDIEQQCRNSGTEYNDFEKTIHIDFLNQSYKISHPDGEVFYKDDQESVPIKDKILIMDYFTRASGAPLTGKLITYKELHDGLNYFAVFHKRAIQPFVTFFGEKPEELIKTGERITNVRQAFNLREGLNVPFKYPERMLGVPPKTVGPRAGLTFTQADIYNEYLKEMDWDFETGKPSKARLLELGLEDIAEALYQ